MLLCTFMTFSKEIAPYLLSNHNFAIAIAVIIRIVVNLKIIWIAIKSILTNTFLIVTSINSHTFSIKTLFIILLDTIMRSH